MRLTWVQADAGRSDDGHISPVRLQSSQLSRGSGTVALLQFAQTSTQQSTEPTAAARPTGASLALDSARPLVAESESAGC
jgi:hypothetical protein